MSFFRPPEAVLITGAQQSRQQEMRSRQRRYSYTMAFRTISFIVAVTTPIPIWSKILLILGALVLPWTAVTAANAGPKRQKVAPGYDAPPAEPLELDPSTIVTGTVVAGSVVPGSNAETSVATEEPDGEFEVVGGAHAGATGPTRSSR